MKNLAVVYKQLLFSVMPVKSYLHFSAEDFVSDAYFQKWILENDYMVNLFWEKWLVDNPKKRNDIDLAKKMISQLTFKKYIASAEDFNEVWKNIKETQIVGASLVESSRRKWYVGVVASIVILVTSAIFLNKERSHFNDNDTQIVSPIIINNSIETGTDKAILTLANGSDIPLVKGETYNTQNASSDGKEIVYNIKATSGKIAYNYLTTPRGGQYFITLSDGTKVWLNSESQLKYPVNFINGETRKVELVYGEAYFDVSPSLNHNGADFKVFNDSQEIQVLGTEFNIKAYKDETHIYTTLVEGEISVSFNGENQKLIPNEQSDLNIEASSIKIATVDVHDEISWKEGVFNFQQKSLKDIMKVLSRWYDMDVVFIDANVEQEKFNGSLRKDQKIEDILFRIKNFGIIKNYRINDKKLILE